ncbi:glycosyltransferase involved in cell wall biosynthesis [Paenibacillus castaneae]|uniref:tetratricopeptide repeat-containing glycosyltransferase family 2 protein n=1 Tax=Paenibacillus castaneae TaxID=474957 RepID=UPI000C9B2EDF|nr:glycosyltransferase family 2 protein [Paenibacillus castaneae]NIK79834.1 glycosyltransferase involved in cell wall biosynthesis [Paenibacillus castaneae]
MISISLCLIVKNEEKTLGRCLSSMKDIADEIIIVDTGSTDLTKQVAGKFTDRVEHFTWINDFAAARNYAFSLATKSYIMWLDADDVLKESDQLKLRELKRNLDPAVDSVTMDYHLAFDEFGNVTSKLKRNRIVKRERGFKWIGPVHEYLEVYGNIFHSDIAVTHSSIHHDSDRNLKIYEQRLAKGEVFSPRDLFYYANELKDHSKFKAAIRYYNQFLDTGKGWIEDNVASCSRLADCYSELKETRKMVDSIFRSFHYDKPRPEFCCRLGFYFLEREEFKLAIYWYKLALAVEKPEQNWGFENLACSTWLPHLQLCVCYDRIGEFETAYAHNELARTFRPTDERIVANRAYLVKRLGKKVGEEAL